MTVILNFLLVLGTCFAGEGIFDGPEIQLAMTPERLISLPELLMSKWSQMSDWHANKVINKALTFRSYWKKEKVSVLNIEISKTLSKIHF